MTCTRSQAPSGEVVTSGHACGSGCSAQTTGSSCPARRARGGGPCDGTRRPSGTACRRSRSIGLPGDAAGARAGDRLARSPAVGGRRALAAPSPSLPPSLVPTATSVPLGSRGERVDGVRCIGGGRGPGRAARPATAPGVGRRAPVKQELLGAGRALEAEEAVTSDLHSPSTTGRCINWDEPLVPPASVRSGVERLTGAGVLRGDPLLHLRRLTVLEPAVRVGHLDAVKDVDDVVAPSPAGATSWGRSGVSLAPCWGACRGSPWSGAAGPCASSSSWT